MAPFQVINEKKIAVLTMIREEKEILFGSFSEKLTKATKIEKWREVHNLAQSIGLVKIEKEWTYTRDVLWPNIKRSTMVSFNIITCLNYILVVLLSTIFWENVQYFVIFSYVPNYITVRFS